MKHLTLLVALAACARANTPPAPKASPYDAKIDALVAAAQKDQHAVGVSVAIARGDTIVVAKGYGFADVAKQVPATADTVYRIGSVTKQFTAVAILQLVEQNKLKLTDDIRTYLPDYPTHGQTITLQHLLTHTSGIPSYTSVANWIEIGAKPMSRAQLLALFADKPLDFQPGTAWAYSNSNYYLLGMVIEAVTKRPYADVIRDKLLVPAGMHASGYCNDAMPHHAQGYSVKTGAPVPARPVDLQHPFAAGALCSTVKDLIAWQRALDRGTLLRPESLAKMRAQAKLADGKPTGYGYGVFLGELAGHPRVGHAGGINGFTAMLARYPADDLTIAVVANAEVETPETLEKAIARLVLDVPVETVKQEQLAAGDRARYVGTYAIEGYGPEAPTLRVFEEGDALRVQATGQPVATLLYQGKHTFRLDLDPEVEIVFPADGAHAAGFTLHQHGMSIEAKRAP